MKYYETIGVIGHKGMVGGVVYKYFKKENYKVYGYDLLDGAEKVNAFKADLIFVCVPTPFNWKTRKFDGSIVDKSVGMCKTGKTVVIKSTVPIGTTDKLQKKYKKVKLLFNPEFLSEATAYEDFTYPDRQFVGYTKVSYKEAIKVLNTLPQSAYEAIMPAKEAELLKYINNLHGILEVVESNHYWEVCKKEGIDYENVLKAALASKWVGSTMGRHYREVIHKGKKGFAGKCFPKDIKRT